MIRILSELTDFYRFTQRILKGGYFLNKERPGLRAGLHQRG